MTRTVSLTKPHLFKGRSHWWCCQVGRSLGTGFTAKAAYDDWLLRNLVAV